MTHFSSFIPKIPNKAILVPNLFFSLIWNFVFFLFGITLGSSANSRVLISNVTIVFKISVQKYPNKRSLVSNLKFFILHKTLHFAKLQGANFKYEKDLFQTPPKNTQIRQFRTRPLRVFFHETLRFLKCVRADIKHGNSLFKEVPA